VPSAVAGAWLLTSLKEMVYAIDRLYDVTSAQSGERGVGLN
jgi:hypothetical protein